MSVVGRKMPRWFPIWLAHCLSNRFLDTDVWLHDAERWARGTETSAPLGRGGELGKSGLAGVPYALPTSSDKGTRLFRAWWVASGAAACTGWGAAPASELRWETRRAQLSRFDSHAVTCAHCRTALARFKRLRTLAPVVALLPLALGLPVPVRLLGLLAFVGARELCARAIRALEGVEAAGDLDPRVLME